MQHGKAPRTTTDTIVLCTLHHLGLTFPGTIFSFSIWDMFSCCTGFVLCNDLTIFWITNSKTSEVFLAAIAWWDLRILCGGSTGLRKLQVLLEGLGLDGVWPPPCAAESSFSFLQTAWSQTQGCMRLESLTLPRNGWETARRRKQPHRNGKNWMEKSPVLLISWIILVNHVAYVLFL